MAILAECPICHKKQAVSHKRCIGKLKGSIPCEADLEKLKRQKEKVRYYISFRIPGGKGKQRMEHVGFSIAEARDADGKRRVQKRENRIFDMLPESEMTFNELTDWYLNLSSVKKLASYKTVRIYINNFNKVFGDTIIGTIKLIDIEDYQAKRLEEGKKPATIDHVVRYVKSMLTKAEDNDMIAGYTLKPFRKIKWLLKRGSNARKRIISFEEHIKLIENSSSHFKPVLTVAFNTGMRSGELQKLKWKYIDKENMFIRLPADVTKERKAKDIPINHNVKDALDSLPRALMHDYVFTHSGKPFAHVNGFVFPFKDACEKAGLPYGRNTPNGFTMHDIRGTVKTNMLVAGIDKVYRDLILGHSLEGMDVHYLAPSEETLRQAMDKFTQWFDGKLAETSQMLTKPLTKTG